MTNIDKISIKHRMYIDFHQAILADAGLHGQRREFALWQLGRVRVFLGVPQSVADRVTARCDTTRILENVLNVDAELN